MNERTNIRGKHQNEREQRIEQMDEWMDGRKDEFMGEWMEKWMKWGTHYMVLIEEKTEVTVIGEAFNVKWRQCTYNSFFNLFFY